MQLPFEVADYVDFYSSRAPRRERRPDLPAGRRRPDARTGSTCRSATTAAPGTVVVSGTDVVRPCGQRKPPDADAPDVRAVASGSTSRPRSGSSSGVPSRAVRRGARRGLPPSTCSASCLLNDWSARDIQAWEYVPLGPFLGKSFATSVSPWVVPLDALRAARVPGPVQEPSRAALPRAATPTGASTSPSRCRWNGDRRVAAAVRRHVLDAGPAARAPHRQRRVPAHRRPVRVRHRVAAPRSTQRGSFLELSWNGTEPVTLADGVDAVVPGGRRRGRRSRASAPGPTATGSASAR